MKRGNNDNKMMKYTGLKYKSKSKSSDLDNLIQVLLFKILLYTKIHFLHSLSIGN